MNEKKEWKAKCILRLGHFEIWIYNNFDFNHSTHTGFWEVDIGFVRLSYNSNI